MVDFMVRVSKTKRQTKGKITAQDIAELKRECEPWQRLAMESWLKIDQLGQNPTGSKSKSAKIRKTKTKP